MNKPFLSLNDLVLKANADGESGSGGSSGTYHCHCQYIGVNCVEGSPNIFTKACGNTYSPWTACSIYNSQCP